MARNEIDKIDVAALVLFPIAAGVVFGIWTLSVTLFGGWSPSESVLTAAGTNITWGLLLAMASIAWIVGTNEIDGSNYEDWEYGAIILAFVSVPAYQFIPAFTNLIDSHDALAAAMWLLTGVVAVYISYTD